MNFDYVLIGNHVNEYIVIKEKLENYKFTYRINVEGLTASKDEDGGILFTDEDDEIIYSIPAPFMYDNDGVYSDAVYYDLAEADGAYILTVQADENWFKEDGRAFPVTIDPDLYVGEYREGEVYDTHYRSYTPNQSRAEEQTMYCGFSHYIKEGIMKMAIRLKNLPHVPNSAIIIDARLNLLQLSSNNGSYFAGNTPIDLGAKMITGYGINGNNETTQWTDLVWNSNVMTEDAFLDYRTASLDTCATILSWNITEAAVKWYSGTINQGIEISTIENYSNTHYVKFYSSENPNTGYYTATMPMFKISYRDNKGLESYWTFHSASADDAGTVYVNDFSGNPVVTTGLFTTAGNILPISVGLVYNGYLSGYYFSSDSVDSDNRQVALTADFSNMRLGTGFKLNVQETIIETTVGNRTYYVHSDSDGTEHYYLNFYGDSIYYSEDGLGWNITKSSGNYILADETGNKKTFNSSGYLTKVEDAVGNTQTYTYASGYTGRLASITSKPSGSNSCQTVTFSYTNGFLDHINNGSDSYIISYSNTTPKKITSITKYLYYNGSLGNGGTISYEYEGNRLLSIASASTSKSVEIEYDDSTHKVIKLTEKVANSIGQSIAFEYTDDKTTKIITSGLNDVLDYVPGGNNEGIDDIYTIYVFDYFGRTITAYTKDLDGNIVSASNAEYNTIINSKSKAVNGISKSGSVGASSINLLNDTSFENSSDCWTGSKNNGDYSISTEQSFTGQKSAKLEVSGGTNAYAKYCQQISLVSGKTYTLSAYVKTSNVTGVGAFIYVNGITGAESMKLTGTTDASIQNGWQRIYCTFNAPATQPYYAFFNLSGPSGVAYFDAVQLEEGAVGAYNLVENGAFLNGSIGWTISGTASASNSVHAPYYAIEMTGDHSGNVTATQTVQLNMPINTTYMLSAWAQGNSADTNVVANVMIGDTDLYQKARTFQIKATIYYHTASGTLSDVTTVGTAEFNPDTNQLQYTVTPIVPNIDSEDPPAKQAYAVVEISYNNNINTAQFLNISFTAEPAQTYAYDNFGNLSSVKSADGDVPTYTFNETDGIDLEHITNSDGSGYDITYDTNTHQPLTVTDKNNIQAAYHYDNYGNIDRVTVIPGSGSGSILTQTSYKDYGRFVETVTDERGKVTTYDYSTSTGLLNYVKDANNNQTQYKYNIFKAITDVFADANKNGSYDSSDDVKVSYVYDTYRNLTQIVT